MTTPKQNEVLFGTARQFGSHVTARGYFRYNKGMHYWEDTNNTARLAAADGGFNPPDGIPRTLYIPNLTAMRMQIGQSGGLAASGSSDGTPRPPRAFTPSKWPP